MCKKQRKLTYHNFKKYGPEQVGGDRSQNKPSFRATQLLYTLLKTKKNFQSANIHGVHNL